MPSEDRDPDLVKGDPNFSTAWSLSSASLSLSETRELAWEPTDDSLKSLTRSDVDLAVGPMAVTLARRGEGVADLLDNSLVSSTIFNKKNMLLVFYFKIRLLYYRPTFSDVDMSLKRKASCFCECDDDLHHDTQ